MAELRWGAATDSGLVRDANEDAFIAEPLVFGVADGMGGHRAGEVAAALASRTLLERLNTGAANIDVVVAAVLEANSAIFLAAHGNAAQQGMGTTVTALVVLSASEEEPEHLALVNVGDSRTYLHRRGELTRATIDHSYVQELVATGHITEAEARTHPRRNIVTRALGIEPTVRVDAWILPVVKGDRFILCSDGLVDEVPDHEIADVAGGIADPQRAADELVAMANRHGGRDNVTVIVVDVIDGLDPEAQPGAATVAARAVAGAADDTDPATVLIASDPDTVEAVDTDGSVTPGAGDGDDTAEMDAGLVQTATETRPRRRLTLRLFLILLAIAAVVALAITLIAVAISNDDSPAPSNTVPDSEPDATVPVTTDATSTTDTATTETPTTDTPTTDAATPSTTARSVTTTSPVATTVPGSIAPQSTPAP